MWFNSLIILLITFIVLYISERINKKVGRKLFPLYYKRIDDIEQRLEELKNLIRLTMINNDQNSYEKLRVEYSELYNKTFIIKIIVNSILFVPVIIFAAIATLLFRNVELPLPAVNLIIFIVGIYFIIKFLISLLKNYFNRHK